MTDHKQDDIEQHILLESIRIEQEREDDWRHEMAIADAMDDAER